VRPQLRRLHTALLVLQVERLIAMPVAANLPFGKAGSTEPARHRARSQSHSLGNRQLRVSLAAKLNYCLVPLVARLAAALAAHFNQRQFLPLASSCSACLASAARALPFSC